MECIHSNSNMCYSGSSELHGSSFDHWTRVVTAMSSRTPMHELNTLTLSIVSKNDAYVNASCVSGRAPSLPTAVSARCGACFGSRPAEMAGQLSSALLIRQGLQTCKMLLQDAACRILYQCRSDKLKQCHTFLLPPWLYTAHATKGSLHLAQYRLAASSCSQWPSLTSGEPKLRERFVRPASEHSQPAWSGLDVRTETAPQQKAL